MWDESRYMGYMEDIPEQSPMMQRIYAKKETFDPFEELVEEVIYEEKKSA